MSDKYELLDALFHASGNHNMAMIKQAEAKLFEYIRYHGEDSQVIDALRMVKILEIESKHDDFEASSDIAALMLDRLIEADEWDFYDLRILAQIIDYAETYDFTLLLAKDAFKRLEDFAHEEKYARVKAALYVNVTARLLRATIYEMDDLQPAKALQDAFKKYTKEGVAFCDKHNLNIHRDVINIRQGIFFKDPVSVDIGFISLKDAGELEVYRMMQDTASEYNYYSELSISKRQFNEIVGKNVRKKRKSLGLRMVDVAELIGVTTPAIALMERGERSITGHNLVKMAYIFKVPVETFFDGIITMYDVAVKDKATYQKLMALVAKFSESELEALVAYAENLPQDKG